MADENIQNADAAHGILAPNHAESGAELEKAQQDCLSPVPIEHGKKDGDGGLVPDESSAGNEGIVYLHGIRLLLLSAVIAVMLFLVGLDVTITTISLIAITRDLGGFETASWVLSAYQLGWVAVIVISSKFSDIFGRKSVFVVSIVAFAVFSGACAAAQTMAQLIVLRAFQGLGGGSCLALATILITEAVPTAKLGQFASKMNVAIIMSLVLGPILGGAISSNTTWRWIFLMNVPICAVALVLVFVGMPNGFPYHGRPSQEEVARDRPTVTRLARVDVAGTVLLLLAALAFTSCFQEADSLFAWNSAYVITLLIVSVVLGAVLMTWERHVTLRSHVREPILPWRFFIDRSRLAVMLCFVFVGVPLVVTNFQLPQRFQLVNGLSSIDAGVRILPFGAAFCIGSGGSTQLSTRLRVPSIYQIFVGSILQVVGYVLLGNLHSSFEIDPAVYGYQVLCGVGVGMNYMALYLLVPVTAATQDKALGMGLAAQLRTMGSAFGLAIATSVFNGYTVPLLAGLGVSTNSITSIQGLADGQQASLSPGILSDVRGVLSEGYNRQMLVLCGFAAAQLPAALLMWRREQITIT